VIELYILLDCEYKVKMYGMNNIKFILVVLKCVKAFETIRHMQWHLTLVTFHKLSDFVIHVKYTLYRPWSDIPFL
jgi:hypothetical protein